MLRLDHLLKELFTNTYICSHHKLVFGSNNLLSVEKLTLEFWYGPGFISSRTDNTWWSLQILT